MLAVLLGRDAATYAKPDKFVRFHQRLSPESLFYPTFSTMENLALARWTPGRILVIVAGNSILNGVGQKAPELWSLRLQEELGAGYVVVNLSFRGSLPCEAGTLVAESLIKRGLPVVLIANTAPGTVGRVAGGPYGYLYYDALAHDRLLSHPARTANLARWEATAPDAVRERQAELRRAAALDARFHFQPLWHQVGYRHAMTVWSEITRPRFWQARERATDLQIGLDVYETEPLPKDSPLRGLPNVALLPHIAGPTKDRRQDTSSFAIENLQRFLQGKPLESVITLDVYDRAT
jgi:hypothetical protein